MTIEVTNQEFLALAWAMQLSLAEAIENPEQFKAVSNIVNTLKALNERLSPHIIEVMAQGLGIPAAMIPHNLLTWRTRRNEES